ncbi:MAG: hypothetical protein QHH14_04475 [Clostridiales bacterium]|nr:hypothetical protein [Clostridiales bacterium]
MRKVSKCLVAALFISFLAAAFPAGNGESAPAQAGESAKLIEVCSNGIVYVPPGTKYVTCRGKIMKVLAIVPRVEGVQTKGNCECPDCCSGMCGITVYCTSVPESSAGRDDCGCGNRSGQTGGLCTGYLSCGD